MKNGARDRLLRRRLVWVLDGVHGGFEVVRFKNDCDLADLGHAILWRILWIFLNDALLFGGLGPILLEQAVADPSLARSGK